MINHNFKSEISDTPDLAQDIVKFANIGTFFFGANNDIYIRTQRTIPDDVNDWVKIYPNPSTNFYRFNADNGSIDIYNEDNITLITENNLILLHVTPNTFKIKSTYLVGTNTPVTPPPYRNLVWIYINTNDTSYWLWNTIDQQWFNFTSAIKNNLDSTYTANQSITWDGTDDQTALEVFAPSPINGSSLLRTILSQSVRYVKAPIAQFEIYDQIGLQTNVISNSYGVSLTYLWSCYPSASVVFSNSTGSTTQITFPSSGVYEITLTITDELSITHSYTKQITVDRTVYINQAHSQYKYLTSLEAFYTWLSSNDAANAALYTVITTGTTVTNNLTITVPSKLIFSHSVNFGGYSLSITLNDVVYIKGYAINNITNIGSITINHPGTAYIENIIINSSASTGIKVFGAVGKAYVNNVRFTGANFLECISGASNLLQCTNSYAIASFKFLTTGNNGNLKIYNNEITQTTAGVPVDLLNLALATGYVINNLFLAYKNTIAASSSLITLTLNFTGLVYYFHNNSFVMIGDTASAITYPGGTQIAVIKTGNLTGTGQYYFSNCNIISEILGVAIHDTVDPNVVFANCTIAGEDYAIYREVQATDTIVSWNNAPIYNCILQPTTTPITYLTSTALPGENIQV